MSPAYPYNGAPTELQQAAYVQALQHQHAAMVDDLISRHLLWTPEIAHPLVEAIGVIRTIIRLNDARECEVLTCSTTGETSATTWRKAA